ncbi:hypothetical protein EsH8_VII_000106 [Colletotrichum jinshuiense]
MANPTMLTPVKPDPQRLFFEPVVLEYALQKSCRLHPDTFRESSEMEFDALSSPMQAFHCFVNKLAQVCDNQRGGKTVTSFVILDSPQGPEYVFGSNDRGIDELAEAQEFTTSLLNLVGNVPPGLGKKPLTKKILWNILWFNKSRIRMYLDKLCDFLDECIKDSDRRQTPVSDSIPPASPTRSDQDVRSELERLKTKTEFPRNVVCDGSKNKFLSDCETLIKAIHATKGNAIDLAIMKNAKDGGPTSSEPWCELRHYLGRLLSFRQAANAIVAAAGLFPQLFHDFKVVSIPSSTPIAKPFPKSSLSAASIINNMIVDDEERAFYLFHVQEMQKFGLDDHIQGQISKRTFKPYVHAEVLLHDYLLHRDDDHPLKYWKDWKYIGSSKPTCRLCHYYFGAHPDRVQVRKSHLNFYPNWCLPRVHGTTPDAKSLHLLEKLTESIRDDAKKTLEEKLPQGKNHDSNTYSTFPDNLRSDFIVSDIASEQSLVLFDPNREVYGRFAASDKHESSVVTVVDLEKGDYEDGSSVMSDVDHETSDGEDDSSVIEDVDPETSDDEDGGVFVDAAPLFNSCRIEGPSLGRSQVQLDVITKSDTTSPNIRRKHRLNEKLTQHICSE